MSDNVRTFISILLVELCWIQVGFPLQNNGNGDPVVDRDGESSAFEEIAALKAQMDVLERDHAQLKDRFDMMDGQSAETKLLVEKYQNR